MHSMVTTVNNAVLHIWKLLKESILRALITRRKSYTVYGDGCWLDCGGGDFMMCTGVRLLGCIFETMVTLYTNYTSIKKIGTPEAARNYI